MDLVTQLRAVRVTRLIGGKVGELSIRGARAVVPLKG
jgi:hypothetical protein